MTKVKAIVGYIRGQLSMSSVSVRERYILLRDQACFKLQFFAGDTAGDLGLIWWLKKLSGLEIILVLCLITLLERLFEEINGGVICLL